MGTVGDKLDVCMIQADKSAVGPRLSVSIEQTYKFDTKSKLKL